LRNIIERLGEILKGCTIYCVHQMKLDWHNILRNILSTLWAVLSNIHSVTVCLPSC